MMRYETELVGLRAEQLEGFFADWPRHPSAEALLATLQRAPYRVLAWEGESVVGFTYAISDGGVAAYIPLLEVRAAQQGRGVGTELIRRLLAQLVDHYMVDAVCDGGLAPFYERFGMMRLTGMAWRNRDAAVLSVGG